MGPQNGGRYSEVVVSSGLTVLVFSTLVYYCVLESSMTQAQNSNFLFLFLVMYFCGFIFSISIT